MRVPRNEKNFLGPLARARMNAKHAGGTENRPFPFRFFY
ncbi:hypothetical protein B4135_3049 [Caldibacillus debilis]|uniref:Uncharacterized protein n=1 Tax=Caldibacillus debilis TaxID=301148 RepID=A0A150LJP6_9BACI|nr:hypothetical protein B4135_3049 [Caldibacillus debilis]